jgi:hypothetical protein
MFLCHFVANWPTEVCWLDAIDRARISDGGSIVMRKVERVQMLFWNFFVVELRWRKAGRRGASRQCSP